MNSTVSSESEIKWGMIGCGNVTEQKSAPAFNKIQRSKLIGVYSRNLNKTKEYARRHGIPLVFENYDDLIQNSEINAVYIATPPDSHAFYAIECLNAGKAVYVEKPMALTFHQCQMMKQVSEVNHIPLFVAYYRRELPYFLYIKKIINEKTYGELKSFTIQLIQPPRREDFNKKNLPWRLIPEIGGMGYFYDLGCHQIDLIIFFFNNILKVQGYTTNRGGIYTVPDYVEAEFYLENQIKGKGIWNFSANEAEKTDVFILNFENAVIEFSTFSRSAIKIKTNDRIFTHSEEFPEHIQQPMIQSVVNLLLGQGKSNANLEDAIMVNYWMEKIVKNVEN